MAINHNWLGFGTSYNMAQRSCLRTTLPDSSLSCNQNGSSSTNAEKLQRCRDRRTLLLKVFNDYRLRRWIVYDRDPKLTEHLWLEFCSVLKINHQFTTAFHTQANVLEEQTNWNMDTAIRGAHSRAKISYMSHSMWKLQLTAHPSATPLPIQHFQQS